MQRSAGFLHPPSIRKKQKHVVITGSSKGLGKAMAKQFCKKGDKVVINSRNVVNLFHTFQELNAQFPGQVIAIPGNISHRFDIFLLGELSRYYLGDIDIWINNAGTCAYKRRNLLELTRHDVDTVINTNLLGTVNGCRTALPIMMKQEFGQIINMVGSGADGSGSPGYSIYGATKAALVQLTRTLENEYADTNIGFHICSPGMVMTELIVSDITDDMKVVFNMFCESPKTVAKQLVPRIRNLRGSGKYIKVLDIFKIVWYAIRYPFNKNRFFGSVIKNQSTSLDKRKMLAKVL